LLAETLTTAHRECCRVAVFRMLGGVIMLSAGILIGAASLRESGFGHPKQGNSGFRYKYRVVRRAHGAACLISDGVWKRRDSLADEAMRQVVDLISQDSVRPTTP
jgi:hypothetical protein